MMRFLLTLLFGVLASSFVGGEITTCPAGSGAYRKLRSTGRCEEYITSSSECAAVAAGDDEVFKSIPSNGYLQMIGCFLGKDGKYHFNPTTYSSKECGYNGMECVCRESICAVCDTGQYSEGGEGSRCKRCPSDKPFTCSNDGKDCLVRGATSIASCSAGPTCLAGSGAYHERRSSGTCPERITDTLSCKMAAVHNEPWDGNGGELSPIPNDHSMDVDSKEPVGCFCRKNGQYEMDLRRSQTKSEGCGYNGQDCICAGAICALCPPGWYGEGGEGSHCKKCPPDKPYTCSSDGKDCFVRGATSIASCSAGPTCEVGYGRYNVMRSSGECQKRITDVEDCKKAADRNRAWDSNSGITWPGSSDIFNKWYGTQKFPRGCSVTPSGYKPGRGSPINVGGYKFTPHSYYKCGGYDVTPTADCICAESVCRACPPGWYGEGGEGSHCKKCPYDKPYTCSNDGKDCFVRGATSIASCSAGPTCEVGYGRYNVMRSSGECQKRITDVEDCKRAADRNRAHDGNEGYAKTGAWEGAPSGCFFKKEETSPGGKYYFNKVNSSTECGDYNSDCVCAASVCTACAPGRYNNHSEASVCKACPLGYSYTCSSDGKDCNARGASSRDSCKAGPDCKAGHGMDFDYGIVTAGGCEENIKSEDECRMAYRRMSVNNATITDFRKEHTDIYPPGCCILRQGNYYQGDYFVVRFNTNFRSRRKCGDSGVACICASRTICTTCTAGLYSTGGAGLTCKTCPSSKPFTYTCGSDGKDCRIDGATDMASCKKERHCKAGQEVGRKGNITSGKCEKNFASKDECEMFLNEGSRDRDEKIYVHAGYRMFTSRHRFAGCYYDKESNGYYYNTYSDNPTKPCYTDDDSEYICLCAVNKNCTACPSGKYSPGGSGATCSTCWSHIFENVSEDQSHCALSPIGVGGIAFFIVAFVSLTCYDVYPKYRKYIINKKNVEFYTDMQHVATLDPLSKLRTSLMLDDRNSRTTPLLSNAESDVELCHITDDTAQWDERNCDRMLQTIHQAETRSALVAVFSEILHCLERDNGRVLFQGSKNRLISIVSAQRRDSKKKIFWDKNMSRLFGQVLDAIEVQ